MKKLIFFLCLSSCSLFSEKSNSVVCIHGFMGGAWCMSFLEKNLKKDGYNVVNWEYPSRDYYIKDHSKNLVKELNYLAKKSPNKPIYFVTHSMGGLVLLSALNDPNCPKEAKIGKVVLITPPLRGSSYARWLGKFSVARWLLKDFSGKEFMTKQDFNDLGNYPRSLEKILVIAGSLGINPLLNKENDGTISIDETILQIPHERVVVKREHNTIVFSKKVSEIIRSFFNKKSESISS